MGLFNRKTKEEKIIEEMKKKKEQINKLKEEMNNMAKLVLKDGKLQKVEDAPKEELKAPAAPVPTPPPQLDTRRLPTFDDAVDEPPRLQQQDVQRMRQQIFQENQRALQEEQMRQAMAQEEALRRQQTYQQPVMPPTPPQQYYQQPVYQQPVFQQPVYQQPMVAPPQIVNINVQVVTGEVYGFEVTTDVLPQVQAEMQNGIDQQTTFTLGNRVFNGRNVISYWFE